MNIYVGNLPFSATVEEIRAAFSAYGAVNNVSIITDKFSGRSKGFGFVEMANDSEAKAAIDGLNEKAMGGRNLRINEARPREEGSSNRGGGGGGGARRDSRQHR